MVEGKWHAVVREAGELILLVSFLVIGVRHGFLCCRQGLVGGNLMFEDTHGLECYLPFCFCYTRGGRLSRF